MIAKAKWLVKEAKLRVNYMTTKDCIFCKIVKGEIKSKPIFETELTLALNDINPVAQVHILIVPKAHIDSVLTIDKGHEKSIMDLFRVAKKIASDKKLDAFRLTFNGGKFQHVPHLHMHLLAGGKIEWNKL